MNKKLAIGIVVVILLAVGGFLLGRLTSPTSTATPTAPAGPSASTDGYGLQPQPYTPHPSSYQETGTCPKNVPCTDNTQTWNISVLDGTTLVYGGFTVGNESNGVYGAIQGPSTVTITVTDGFYSVVKNEWAQQEYCFRLLQVIRYGWAHAHLHPLQGWSCQ